MTDREFLLSKIRAEKQWIKLLTDKRYSKVDLGLPKNVIRREAIDESLDRLIEFRNQLKQLKNE